jgi:hypothetical protein
MVIRHEFYEAATGYRYPIVAHEFSGETLEEARRYFHAHLRYDRMLRAVASLGHGEVGATGNWNGIQFRSIVRVVQR